MPSHKTTPPVHHSGAEFTELASGPRRGVVAEIAAFIVSTRKWWLVPVLLTLAVAGLLIVLGSTSAAPFIYTIF